MADLGLMAGGFAQGLNTYAPLIARTIEHQKTMELAKVQHDQEMNIKKAMMAIDILKSPDIPDELKLTVAKNAMPSFQTVGLDMSGINLDEWTPGHTTMAKNFGKLLDGYRKGSITADDTIAGANTLLANARTEVQRKAAEEYKGQIAKEVLFRGRSHQEERWVPNEAEKLSEAQTVDVPLSEEQRARVMLEIPKDDRAYLQTEAEKITITDPISGRPIKVDSKTYLDLLGITPAKNEIEMFDRAMRAEGITDPAEKMRRYIALKERFQRDTEMQKMYDSYMKRFKADPKNQGKTPLDYDQFAMQFYTAKREAEAERVAEAAVTGKARGKIKARKIREEANNTPQSGDQM